MLTMNSDVKCLHLKVWIEIFEKYCVAPWCHDVIDDTLTLCALIVRGLLVSGPHGHVTCDTNVCLGSIRHDSSIEHSVHCVSTARPRFLSLAP